MANTAWTNGGRERTTRMTDRWSTKCAQPARASPLYTLELAPVLAQIGLLKLRPLGPLVPHVLQSSFHASVPPRNFHRFDSPRSSSQPPPESVVVGQVQVDAFPGTEDQRRSDQGSSRTCKGYGSVLTWVPWIILLWQETG